MTRDPARNLKLLLAATLILSGSAAAQRMTPYAAMPAARERGWTFGPVKPHVRDATKRTAYGLVGGALFMAVGLGIDELNQAQCKGATACMGENPVQTGMSFAFLGTLLAATGPQWSSKCTRSGRAMLGILGAIVGSGAAGAIADVRLFNALRDDPASVRTMSAGLLGLGVGAGVATAIC